MRIKSVDFLRGLTIAAMILVNNPGSWGHIYAPLEHAEWHGLTPTDLIFPFFLYIVGISISIAYKDKTASYVTYRKIVIRSLKLVLLGIVLSAFLPTPPFIKSFEIIRFPGVLQRIGVVFFVTAILFLNVKWKTLLYLGIGILLAYWLLLGFVDLPSGMAPTFDRASNNWANYLDLKAFGTHMWQPDYDPEGLLSTLPAIVTCIIGVLMGKLLLSNTKGLVSKFIFFGAIQLIVGYVWSIWFPLNKALWSSSFVLVTGGYATIILAIIYYLNDVKQIKFGSVFSYMGMNAIGIFFLSGVIAKSFYKLKVNESESIHGWLYNHLYIHSFLDDKQSSLLYALTVLLFYIGLGHFLFKKKIFIKV